MVLQLKKIQVEKKKIQEKLLLFAIKMATLPFWAEIKNLRSRSCKAHKFFSSGRIDLILSDS